MKIKAIELTKEEEDQIFEKLIEMFDPQSCAQSTKGIEINFPLNDQIDVYATLDLNVEYDEFDSNHQCSPIDVYSTFKMDFYHNGLHEVKGMENSDIYNRIEKHDRFQYF